MYCDTLECACYNIIALEQPMIDFYYKNTNCRQLAHSLRSIQVNYPHSSPNEGHSTSNTIWHYQPDETSGIACVCKNHYQLCMTTHQAAVKAYVLIVAHWLHPSYLGVNLQVCNQGCYKKAPMVVTTRMLQFQFQRCYTLTTCMVVLQPPFTTLLLGYDSLRTR